jgi:hypothetical protein
VKTAAWIVLAGSAVFQLGAFLPVSRFYMAAVAERLAIMQNQPIQWMLHLGGMGVGSLIAAAGLIVLGIRLPRGTPTSLGVLAAATVVVGTTLWLWHLQLRIGQPVAFASGENPVWHFAVYTALMQVALLLLAGAFRDAGMPQWMVLVLGGGALLTVLAFVIFQDVPPFLHYVWLLTVSIGLVR